MHIKSKKKNRTLKAISRVLDYVKLSENRWHSMAAFFYVKAKGEVSTPPVISSQSITASPTRLSYEQQ